MQRHKWVKDPESKRERHTCAHCGTVRKVQREEHVTMTLRSTRTVIREVKVYVRGSKQMWKMPACDNGLWKEVA